MEARVLTGRQDAETEYLGQEIDGIDDMDEEKTVYCTRTCINAVMPRLFA